MRASICHFILPRNRDFSSVLPTSLLKGFQSNKIPANDMLLQNPNVLDKLTKQSRSLVR